MINYDLTRIRSVVFDVDGVLSAATILLSADGEPLRTMNIKDGYAIQLACKRGLHVAIITGGNSSAVRKRYEGLGIKDVYMKADVKLKVYEELCARYGLNDEEVLYVGDDIPDYEIMSRVGCACCPKDACAEIKSVSCYVSDCIGGSGVARDILEQVLKVQGKWTCDQTALGW